MNESEMIDEVRKLALEGLLTDGGHHKQWYLEQILAVANKAVRELQTSVTWEPGIAP